MGLSSVAFPLVSRHAEDAAFYRARFVAGTLQPFHDLRSLQRFEFLLEANLEGLRVAQQESAKVGDGGELLPGVAGWEATWTRVSRWQTADEAFVAAYLALERAIGLDTAAPADHSLLELVAAEVVTQLDEEGELELARGLAGAAACLPWALVRPLVIEWSASNAPALRWSAVAVLALQRVREDALLRAALHDASPCVRSRALEAVGELGVAEAAPLLRHAMLEAAPELDPESAVRAAGSLCLLGHRDVVPRVMEWAFQRPGDPRVLEALAAGLQLTTPAAARSCIQALLDKAGVAGQLEGGELVNAPRDLEAARAALHAIRYAGDPRWVGTLLDIMLAHTQPGAIERHFREPRANLARLAAEVFSHLTGAEIGDGLWMAEPEPPASKDGEADPDANPGIPVEAKEDPDEGLHWPDAAGIRRWWDQNAGRVLSEAGEGGRVLAGRRLTVETARQYLQDPLAPQLQRHHAALYLRCHQVTPMLFDVRAPVRAQLQALQPS